ncbi:MAG: hypothetical protein PUB96_08640 [Helicobacteraceae bacterium]|nr:hypothetical protein [Helicobacteraceae bacterium]
MSQLLQGYLNRITAGNEQLRAANAQAAATAHAQGQALGQAVGNTIGSVANTMQQSEEIAEAKNAANAQANAESYKQINSSENKAQLRAEAIDRASGYKDINAKDFNAEVDKLQQNALKEQLANTTLKTDYKGMATQAADFLSGGGIGRTADKAKSGILSGWGSVKGFFNTASQKVSDTIGSITKPTYINKTYEPPK